MSARGRVVFLICLTLIGLVAVGLIAGRGSSRDPIKVLIDLDESKAAGIRLRFAVANPSADAAMSHIRYECAFDFPDVIPDPGAITSVTFAVDRDDAIEASQKREFQCIPFIPPDLKSSILAHVLFFHRGGLLGADGQETISTPYYLWLEGAGRRGWVEMKEADVPASLLPCRSSADPLGLCWTPNHR